MASLLDEAPGAVLGLLPCFVMGSQQLFRDLFGAPAATPARAAAAWPRRFKSSSVLIPKVYGPLSGDVQRRAPRAQMGLVASGR